MVEWLDIIGNLGFPIFVAVWLLVRSDRILRELTSAINSLAAAVDLLKKE